MYLASSRAPFGRQAFTDRTGNRTRSRSGTSIKGWAAKIWMDRYGREDGDYYKDCYTLQIWTGYTGVRRGFLYTYEYSLFLYACFWVLSLLLPLTDYPSSLYAGLSYCPNDRALRRHIHLIPPRYNIICLSSAVLAAEFSRFGRCFTLPRPLTCRSHALVCLARLAPQKTASLSNTAAFHPESSR